MTRHELRAATTVKQTKRWHVAPHCQLKWRCWDDEYVVYHCPSGDTHYLNATAAAALRTLQQIAADADELTRRVAESVGLVPSDELLEQMEQLLVEFDELGLVEPVDEAERSAQAGPD